MDTTMTLSVNQLGCLRERDLLFSNLSFHLQSGQMLLVEGANGSGKSTLLRLVAGLMSPTQGDVLWCHSSIYSAHDTFNEQLHYIGHQNGVKLGLTVAENLQLTKMLSEKEAPALDQSVLTMLKLETLYHTLAKNLSAGQKRRLALAKLFISPKKLWVLDEPFTALDVDIQHYFLTKLEEHLAQGGMAVVSSHHPIALKNQSLQTLRLGTC